MARTLVAIVAFVGALAGTSGAQMMGDTLAATGVHSTLAATGAVGAAGILSGVKNATGNAAATHNGQLEQALHGWGGKGGPSGWATHSGTGGWKTAGGTSGWASAAGGKGGWASASSGGKGWANGGWNTNKAVN